MKFDTQNAVIAGWDDVLPKQFYGKPELRSAYFSFIAQTLSLKFNPETVLDIGCGTGDLVIAFRSLSIQAIGMDLNGRKILLASKSGKGFLTADIEKIWPIPDNSFDMVIALEVLEHITAPALCISEAKRVLKPGGIVFITTPSPIPAVSSFIHFIFRRYCAEHVSEYPRTWWIKTFRQLGFKYEDDLVSDIKKWRAKYGFFWELAYPEKLFLPLGYPGRYIASALLSLFNCALVFRKQIS